MKDVQCIPLTSFAHGDIDAHEGHPLLLEAAVARELEAAGLIRFPAVVAPKQEATGGNDSGKATDDGAGSPSSASPAAQVSPPTTSKPSSTGATRTRKGGR